MTIATSHKQDRSAQLPTLTQPPVETSATCFDCCLSQEILDGGNGWLTT
jgi:hypothetical protein